MAFQGRIISRETCAFDRLRVVWISIAVTSTAETTHIGRAISADVPTASSSELPAASGGEFPATSSGELCSAAATRLFRAASAEYHGSATVEALIPASDSSPRQIARAYWAWIAVCISWGTTFLATRVAIESIPPFAMAGPRHFVAGIILALILRARGVPLPSRESWGGHALLGLLMIGMGNGCLVWAQQFIPSGVAAVLVSVIPFWMIGVETFMPNGEPILKRQVIGLVLGFFGIMLLTTSSMNGSAPTPQIVLGVIMTQLSCLGWAVGSAYSKRHKREENLFAATAVQITIGGAILMVVATLTGEWGEVTPTSRSLIAVLYLVVVGTFVGYVCYVYALKHLPVSIVSLYAYVNPVIAVILGSLLLKERFAPRMAVAIAIIFAAMLIVRSVDTSRSS